MITSGAPLHVVQNRDGYTCPLCSQTFADRAGAVAHLADTLEIGEAEADGIIASIERAVTDSEYRAKRLAASKRLDDAEDAMGSMLFADGRAFAAGAGPSDRLLAWVRAHSIDMAEAVYLGRMIGLDDGHARRLAEMATDLME